MQIQMDIERVVRHIAAINYDIKKTDQELLDIIKLVNTALSTDAYNFDDLSTIVLNQNGKKRIVKKYDDIFSAENVLCQHIKHVLDREFKIKYPNRNKAIRSLFSYIAAAKQMTNFTVVKFDFKDYYNSVSSIYVFEKYIRSKIKDRFELELIHDFVYKTKYAYAGLCTSNVIAEIVAKDFDREIKNEFLARGLLFYERYIDDCILILNENTKQADVQSLLDKILKKVFDNISNNDIVKCKTKFNAGKFQFLSKKTLISTPVVIDYLGYEFSFSKAIDDKVEIVYGITLAKQQKYRKRLDKIISLYTDSSSPDYNDLELLRHRILAFSSRVVYINKHFNRDVWKVKGFISNYGELRYLLDKPSVLPGTKDFLLNMIRDAFLNNGVSLPYFMKPNGYNLFESMKKNKTILLVDNIGYDYNSLVNLCKQIDIPNVDTYGKKRGYGTLVRDYLIKVKVGY